MIPTVTPLPSSRDREQSHPAKAVEDAQTSKVVREQTSLTNGQGSDCHETLLSYETFVQFLFRQPEVEKKQQLVFVRTLQTCCVTNQRFDLLNKHLGKKYQLVSPISSPWNQWWLCRLKTSLQDAATSTICELIIGLGYVRLSDSRLFAQEKRTAVELIIW